MKCPVCYNPDTKVVDSRSANEGATIRRRRECLKCGFRFSTYEEMEILDLCVLKRDGRKEAYSKDKLISGLKKSFEKRPVTEEQLKRLVNKIEMDLQAINRNEIGSEKIGEIVMKHIKRQDKVAYIRFASVYLDFKGIEEFKEALDKLVVKKKK